MTRRDRKRNEERLSRLAVAAEWMETLKSAERRDHAAFDEWLRESKLNVESYLELEALDRQVQSLDVGARPDIEGIAATLSPRVSALTERIAERRSERTARGASWKWISLAAALVVAVMLMVVGTRATLTPQPQTARTERGAQRTLALPDGSVVRMNGDTVLEIDYGPDRRSLQLTSGEAIFKVAADPRRPFVVQTPTAVIRALGTQFNVYQRQSTVVSVIEGRVQLTTLRAGSAATPESTQRLEAGEQAKITRGTIHKEMSADVTQAIAWRKSQLYFSNAPLEEIVAEYNRSGPAKIRIDGVPPRAYRFSGTFNVEEPQSLADILKAQDGLVVERREGEIVVRARD